MLFATSSRARFGEEDGDIPQFLANGVRPHARSQVFERHVRGLTPFARCAGNWGMSPFSSPAAARRKPTGLNICRNGCAEMHRGGPYWLPPRRAPFGRKEIQPPARVPPASASPRSRVHV